MQDILTRVGSMKRPTLLGKAARIGAPDYRREAHLPRLLKLEKMPRHAEALLKLMELEGDLNERRRMGEATYSVARHIEVLIAIVGESALLRASKDRFALV